VHKEIIKIDEDDVEPIYGKLPEKGCAGACVFAAAWCGAEISGSLRS
jgi:hypothetical protein